MAFLYESEKPPPEWQDEDAKEILWLKDTIKFFKKSYLNDIFSERSKLYHETIINLERELNECQRIYKLNWLKNFSNS